MLCAISWLLAGCAPEPPSGPRVPAAPRPAQMVVAEASTRAAVVEVFGSLLPADATELAFQVAGRIATLDADVGAPVAAGAPLATLDPLDFDLEVQRAEAALQQARVRLGLTMSGDEDAIDPEATSTVRGAQAVLAEATLALERARGMTRQDLSSRAVLDAAVAAHAVAEARVQEAREEVRNRQALLAQRRVELAIAHQRRRDSVLEAPFAGVVTARLAAPGRTVAPGEAVLALERVDVLRLRLKVPERAAAGMHAGLAVEFTVDGDPTVRSAQLARVSPSLDPRDRTLLVEADVANPDRRLRAGAFARARIATDAHETLALVPAAAVTRLAGTSRVLTVRDGKTLGLVVEVLEGAPEGRALLRGLAPGTEVVADARGVAPGAAVEPRR